jgi:hypothetical protein
MPPAELLHKIDDAREGLKEVTAAVLHEASWEWCYVHVLSNALAPMPRAAGAGGPPIRTAFAEPDPTHLFPRVVTSAPSMVQWASTGALDACFNGWSRIRKVPG